MAALDAFRLSLESQQLLSTYIRNILDSHAQFSDFTNKLEAIDISYARYQSGDEEAGQENCGVSLDNIIVPVVISQVESFVGYLAEVFLSGLPMFPVVSTPKFRKEAERLEAIIDSHATFGSYPRQLLIFFRDAVKYNFAPLEITWSPMSQYSVMADYLKPTEAARLNQSTNYITKLRRLDPYNTLWDKSVDPANISTCGEYAGDIQLVSRIELKRLLRQFNNSTDGYNTTAAFNTSPGALNAAVTNYYTELPQISALISAKNKKDIAHFNWVNWLNNQPQNAKIRRIQYSSLYEFITLYCRIIPEEFKMNVPQASSPQIWKLCSVNGEKLVHAKRVISAFDNLPIMIGQPLEDGFSYQTQSVAENEIPIQDAASTLFNIKFNAARRAVSDRAIYDATMLDSSDVNSPIAAPKIPLKHGSMLGGKTIEQAYKSIPFESRGLETVMGDAERVIALGNKLSGLNRPMQGEFQKGNKSVREWVDTMEGANNRPRLLALCLEYQIFQPVKETIKLNIFQYGPTGTFQNNRTGEVYSITAEDIEKLKKANLSFKIADGYTPKSKLASTEFLSQGMNIIGQSQYLQQAWGQALPNMFSHLMSLGGVKGLEEYLPEIQNAPGTGQAGAIGGGAQTPPITPNSPTNP